MPAFNVQLCDPEASSAGVPGSTIAVQSFTAKSAAELVFKGTLTDTGSPEDLRAIAWQSGRPQSKERFYARPAK